LESLSWVLTVDNPVHQASGQARAGLAVWIYDRASCFERVQDDVGMVHDTCALKRRQRWSCEPVEFGISEGQSRYGPS
jgi:hypothetical protein